jgi:hypothetical protein
MPIPKQVEEAGKKADEMLAEQNKPVNTDVPAASEAPPVDPAPAVVDNPKPPEPPPAVKKDDENTLQHRVSVLQGMLDKRNAEFRDLERTLNADIVGRDRKINELNQRIAELEKKPPQAVIPQSVITDEERQILVREGLSEEATKIIEKIAGGVAGSVVDQRTKPLEQRVETVSQDTLQDKNQRFWNALNAAVPDWEQVNIDIRWNQWLAQRVPKTGYTRQDIINASQERLDPTKIIDLLNDFKKFVGWGQQPDPKSKMEEKVEVIKPSVQVASSQPVQGKIWKSSEITQFYAQATATKMAVRNPDEYNRIDQEIQQAALEGRVQR